MQDIIPANKGFPRKPSQANKKVVKLHFQLPARLHRPIRPQIARQTKQAKEKKAVIQFERRPILTRLPSRQPPTYSKNTGTEHHTGDVYMQSRPDSRLPVPPYAGDFIIQKTVGTLTKHKTPTAKVISAKQPLDKKRVSPKVINHNKPIRRLPKKTTSRTAPTFNLTAGYRDVPYEFARQQRLANLSPTKTGSPKSTQIANQADPLFYIADHVNNKPGVLTKPKRPIPFTLPSLTRIFTGGLPALIPKRVAINLIVLLIGCTLLYTAHWNLRGLSRGIVALSNIEDTTGQAYGRILSASSALAAADFTTSQQDFNDAAKLLESAERDLNEALSSSKYILRFIDLTGTVRSGQELLEAGEKLSLAGQHISRGVKPLVNNSTQQSFINSFNVTKQEFNLAFNDLSAAQNALSKVNSPLLPNAIKNQVEKLKTTLPQITANLSTLLDQSDVIMSMLGSDRDRKYLLLFQNNHEIRPTGGFIGSIGLVNIDRGSVEEIDISSVYDPDGQLKEFIAPPEPMRKVTNRWYLRDSNWFVDFPVNARKAIDFFEREGGPTVDGVIALTPEVIRQLLQITGPINVPAYNLSVTYQNFWEVTQDQVSYSYDKQLNQPKKFLADLTPLLLEKLFADSPSSSLETLQGITRMIKEKHLLLYFNNPKLQQHITSLGWSGSVPQAQPGFLAVNNANIAGHKSDQFIDQEIDYRLEMDKFGNQEAIVTIRRTHRGPTEKTDYEFPPDENPALKDNIVWQRILVPLGSQLIEATGFTPDAEVPTLVVPEELNNIKADPGLADWQTGQTVHDSGTIIGQESGYSLFGNWLVTKPGRTTVALYKYRLPEKNEIPSLINPVSNLDAYVYKQPGDTRTSIRVELKLPPEYKIIHTVPQEGITLNNEQNVVYRGAQRSDILTAVVFEKRPD